TRFAAAQAKYSARLGSSAATVPAPVAATSGRSARPAAPSCLHFPPLEAALPSREERTFARGQGCVNIFSLGTFWRIYCSCPTTGILLVAWVLYFACVSFRC
ncbi:unnamed protein product, partial [Amoebophrya sp. A120]